MKNKTLTVKERLGLGGLLNRKYEQKGLTLSTLSISQKILDKIQMDEDERKKLDFKVESGRVTWDIKKDKGKDIEFNEEQIKFMKEIVDGFSKSESLALEDGYLIGLMEKLGTE